jgi:uncharacterized coiled-coil protein SlyX
MSDPITELEVRYSYLENEMRQLDGVVIELRAEVERLRHELRVLRETLLSPPDDAPAGEKPPHY